MLSKNKAKLIKSLQLKKRREEEGLFAVEGTKSVLELLGSQFQVETVLCAEDFLRESAARLNGRSVEKIVCSQSELESVSAFKTINSVMAVAKIPVQEKPKKFEGLTLALDSVSDPGNLGTILRTADWFGHTQILASKDSADFYNPKVIQASMGSFCRVKAHYVDLNSVLKDSGVPVYAAGAKGKDVHAFPFEKNCILVLGSESHGVSKAILSLARDCVGIPAYGKAESLNVSAAAAILCDNYARRF